MVLTITPRAADKSQCFPLPLKLGGGMKHICALKAFV